MSIHNGPLHKLDLPFIGPWTWIRQAHSTRPVGLYFYPLQLPLHLVGPSSLRGRTKWGDGSKFMGWQFQCLWVDGSNACGLTVLMWTPSTVQTSDRLSGRHYGVWHVSSFDWFLSRIEVSLRLPCNSAINTRVYLSHFFIFSWNIFSERNRHPCQRPPRSFCYINNRHAPSVHLIHPSSTHFLHSLKKKNLVSVLFPRVLEIHFLF